MKPLGTMILFLTLTALGLSSAESPAATGPRAKHHQPARMTAKVSADSARALALAEVPRATVKSQELEREHGKLVYSFDLSVPGRSGIEEVQVDAISGRIVSKKHETPAAEHKEQAKEKREAHAKVRP